MSALTEDQLKAEQRCKDAIRSINLGARAHITEYLLYLMSEENERLLTTTDVPMLYRAQGATKNMQKVIELLNTN